MTRRVLELRRRDCAQRETSAWLLSGSEPADWLAELSRWRVPLEDLRCYIVPRGSGDDQPGGLLVVPPKNAVQPKDARAMALGMISGKLLLPVEAELFPPVAATEIATLCRAAVALFHPSIGLVELESADACGVWELLAPPTVAATDWNAAHAGMELPERLKGVMLKALPQMVDIFGEARKDIGSEPMVNLPPRPKEPSIGLGGKIGRTVLGLGAGAAQKFFSMLPSGGTKRNWVDHILDWASAKLTGISQELEDLRHRELLRLMQMLEKDPERGLRHALPLGGEPGRGRTPPGGRLGMRSVDFNLGHIGGGQAADPWNVPWELRQKLTKRYRELALHEQQLGRFKRAAYIHAELLGDLSAAAAVLKEGRLFAEAAVLYRDHLRQPLAAAECFVAGGLFAEAVGIYEKEGKWVELGDLHRRLENEEEAEHAYRRAVEAKMAAFDFLGAAELLEVQLRNSEEALTLLHRSWPATSQAARCLEAEFGLLGRLARHDAARHRLGELRKEATPPGKAIPLGEVLDAVRRTYPDTLVQRAAIDLARIKVSEGLACGDLEDARRGVQIIAQLAPEDRLLARDASRFLADRTAALQKSATVPPPPPRKPGSGRLAKPNLLGSIPLARGLQWLAVRRVGSRFVALATKQNRLIALRSNWQGQSQEVASWTRGLEGTPGSLDMAADEARSQPDFLVPLPLRTDRHVQTIPVTDSDPGQLHVGVPSWVPNDAFTLRISGTQWWLLRISEGHLLLEERAKDGRLIGSFDVSLVMHQPLRGSAQVILFSLRGHVWIACGPHLFLFKNGKMTRRWELESSILGFEASAPFLSCAVVARCEQGVAVFFLDALSDHVEMIASHLARPRAVFLGNGTLVLLAGTSDGRGCEGIVVDIDRRGIHSEEKFYKNGHPPIALIGTDRTDDFAVFDGSNSAEVWRVTTKG